MVFEYFIDFYYFLVELFEYVVVFVVECDFDEYQQCGVQLVWVDLCVIIGDYVVVFYVLYMFDIWCDGQVDLFCKVFYCYLVVVLEQFQDVLVEFVE